VKERRERKTVLIQKQTHLRRISKAVRNAFKSLSGDAFEMRWKCV